MKKSVAIELDKVRNLRYGINALCQLEDMLGKPITKLQNETGIKEFRVILYCGLIWEDKTLTLEKIGDLMDEAITEKGIDYINDKVSEALELALGNNKKK
ncbi:hypothetical protein [Caloranaerobacter ferrireducens]|uniref:hypothetical protein n=1 Tax=Caloranaerobacter ferrireducens TaxID=1323370 RepID=UPI00084D329D|nr:hypothetical protein [Caloranaerobacter ferrireducens]